MNEQSAAKSSENSPKEISFDNRWRICGTLTLISNLHIGDGDTIPAIENRDSTSLAGNMPADAPEASAFVMDFKEKPYIPASALKGNLRSWLERKLEGDTHIHEIFGKDASKSENGIGGKAEFLDAPMEVERKGSPNIESWNDQRQTGIETSITVNRARKTAREKKLFNTEYVPAGAAFKVEIIGQNMRDEEIALLLIGLEEGFSENSADPITIGGDTGTGKGHLKWGYEAISVMKPGNKEFRNWLKNENGNLSCAWEALNKEEKMALEEAKNKLKIPNNNDALKIPLKLKFDYAFMVAHRQKQKADDKVKGPDFIARKTVDGKAILPGKSFKGVLRSQAERIIRTLVTSDKWKTTACRIDNPRKACKPYDKSKENEGGCLCLVCQMFGGTGYASRITVSDFACVTGEKMEQPQEFVAIDRFTGGGADGAKFNAQPWVKPVMSGTVTLSCADKPWALGLLALVMRDLIEGDLTFGYGAAKGYGSCRVGNKDEVIKKLNGYQTSLVALKEKLGLPVPSPTKD